MKKRGKIIEVPDTDEGVWISRPYGLPKIDDPEAEAERRDALRDELLAD